MVLENNNSMKIFSALFTLIGLVVTLVLWNVEEGTALDSYLVWALISFFITVLLINLFFLFALEMKLLYRVIYFILIISISIPIVYFGKNYIVKYDNRYKSSVEKRANKDIETTKNIWKKIKQNSIDTSSVNILLKTVKEDSDEVYIEKEAIRLVVGLNSPNYMEEVLDEYGCEILLNILNHTSLTKEDEYLRVFHKLKWSIYDECDLGKYQDEFTYNFLENKGFHKASKWALQYSKEENHYEK